MPAAGLGPAGATLKEHRLQGVNRQGEQDHLILCLPALLAPGRAPAGSYKLSGAELSCAQALPQIKSTVPFSTPFVVDAAAPPPPRDWGAVLAGAGLQQGVTGKTVEGVYTGKGPDPELAAAEKAAA